MISPIVLFTYNRLWHTEQIILALKKNKLSDKSDLIIFSDGPKNETDAEKVLEVHHYLEKISGFRSVTIHKSQINKGLANSIIQGVTEVVNKYGKIIVLEDDMITSPFFLEFMNKSLDLYENDDRVISIHGYIYPVKKELPDTFFLKGADCWGWATWKRGWDLFDTDGERLLKELEKRKLCHDFDFGGSYPYTQMLRDQINGKNNSWAIRWYASAFLNNKVTLYPGKSLVQNIGLDDSGSHGSVKEFILTTKYSGTLSLVKLDDVSEDIETKKKIADFLATVNTTNWLDKILLFMKVLQKLKVKLF